MQISTIPLTKICINYDMFSNKQEIEEQLKELENHAKQLNKENQFRSQHFSTMNNQLMFICLYQTEFMKNPQILPTK